MHDDTKRIMLEVAMEPLIENVNKFVQEREGYKVVCGQSGEMTSLAKLPSTSKGYISLYR